MFRQVNYYLQKVYEYYFSAGSIAAAWIYFDCDYQKGETASLIVVFFCTIIWIEIIHGFCRAVVTFCVFPVVVYSTQPNKIIENEGFWFYGKRNSETVSSINVNQFIWNQRLSLTISYVNTWIVRFCIVNPMK